MVRFSDILGGTSEPEEVDPIAAALAADWPAPGSEDDAAEPTGENSGDDASDEASEAHDQPEGAPPESPEDVLERLTRYATSARATEPAPLPEAPAPIELAPIEPATGEMPEDEPTNLETLAPIADDILPSGKNPSEDPEAPRRGRRHRS